MEIQFNSFHRVFAADDCGLIAQIALAHVRGGGELGEGWHVRGRGKLKENSVLDCEACVLHLCNAGRENMVWQC